LSDSKDVILVVDDNEYGRYATSRMLKQAGFEVIEADTGKSAIEMAYQNPSVIVLDINLPDMSGFDVCKILKEKEDTKYIPIIFLTAHYFKIEDKIVGLEMGADAYLTQPVQPAELVATVNALLRLRKIEYDLKEREETYRKLYSEFNALLSAIPDNILLLDKELKIIWVNDAVEKRIGKRLEEIKGHHCYNVIYGYAIPCNDCPSIKAINLGSLQEGTVITPDNLIIDLRSVPVRDKEGNITGVVMLGRDVTEHRKLEEQLRQQQKLESIGQFAGGIAHDFNNILSAVMGFANLIQMNISKDSPISHYVEQIVSATQKGADLTRQILAFGRKQILDIKDVDLNELIKNLSGMLRRILREDIMLNLSLCDEPVVINADPVQIDQVILNLTSNARDAMPNGGHLDIKTEIVNIDENFISFHGYGTAGKYAKITVTDTGIGMSKDIMDRIFEPFFTTKEQGKGTGLGLSVVYGIVKQHKGFINCYSEVGKGTTFTIYLPMIDKDVEIIIKKDIRDEINLEGKEGILIAEDDDYSREMFKEVFETLGYKVFVAKDGLEAIEKYSENKDKIDIILLDLIMPKKNGEEVSLEIKEINPKVKFLFMSGYPSDVFYENGKFDRSIEFIQKPASPDEIAKRVRKLLVNSK